MFRPFSSVENPRHGLRPCHTTTHHHIHVHRGYHNTSNLSIIVIIIPCFPADWTLSGYRWTRTPLETWNSPDKRRIDPYLALTRAFITGLLIDIIGAIDKVGRRGFSWRSARMDTLVDRTLSLHDDARCVCDVRI